MRLVAIATLYVIAAVGLRAEVAIGTKLTVILDFEKKPGNLAFETMKQEVSHLLRRTGVRLDLQLRTDLQPFQDFEDLALMRFRGNCDSVNMAPLIDERGPLGWSHTIEGEILSFGDVACDKVHRAVESALWGAQRARKAELFGRALGRVVAHELYHIIAGTHQHGKRGVAQASLSGQELIADNLDLAPEDAHRLRIRSTQYLARTRTPGR